MSICVKKKCKVDCKENVNLQDLIYENNEGERLSQQDILPSIFISSYLSITTTYYNHLRKSYKKWTLWRLMRGQMIYLFPQQTKPRKK